MGAFRNIVLGGLLLTFAGCSAIGWTATPGTSSFDWPQQGGGAVRSSAVRAIPSDASGMTEDGDAWEFSLDGRGGSAGPLLVGDMLLLPSVSASVEAVDLATADKLGEVNCSWFIEGAPAVLGGRLFVATVGTESPLFCFDVRTGKKQWSRMFEPVTAALCAHDGAVFAAGLRGNVARFDPDDSVEVWETRLSGPVRAAPAAADSILVVGTEEGDLYGLSIRSGVERWRVPTLSAIEAGPVIMDGCAITANLAGRITAVDLHSGEVRWEQDFGSPVYYAPAVRNDRILLPLSSGDLVMISVKDGKVLRRYPLGELPGASPLLADDAAWQLARKGVLYRLDLSSGEWTIIHTLPARSETPLLMTPRGILLVDEEGEAIMVEVE